jgi:hypothetical protein
MLSSGCCLVNSYCQQVAASTSGITCRLITKVPLLLVSTRHSCCCCCCPPAVKRCAGLPPTQPNAGPWNASIANSTVGTNFSIPCTANITNGSGYAASCLYDAEDLKPYGNWSIAGSCSCESGLKCCVRRAAAAAGASHRSILVDLQQLDVF